jgi:hypothetical protein
MLKTYKIRSFKNGQNKDGKPFMNYSITVPAKIAEVLPDDVQFSVELTEDGLLFRRAEVSSDDVTVPSWANGNGSSAKAPAKAKAKAKPAAKTAAKSKPAAKPKAKAKPAAKAGARKRPGAAKADTKPATRTRKRPAKAAA